MHDVRIGEYMMCEAKSCEGVCVMCEAKSCEGVCDV